MKNNVDKQYLEALQYILDNGELKEDRTGTGTLSIFDYTMTFDMSEGFPLLTSKKVFTKAVIHELIWFLRGDTNIKYLVDNGVNIWNGDAYKHFLTKNPEYNIEVNNNTYRRLTKEEFIEKIKTDEDFAKKWGELGPVYGKQWRRFAGTEKVPNSWNHGSISSYKELNKGDQIKDLVNNLKKNPDSRRLIVNAWNVSELDEMVLPPCFLEQTKVLCKGGFYKEIKEIKEGDLVLTEDFSFQSVYDTHKTKYKGDILKFTLFGNNTPIEVTPNHPFLVKGKGYIESSTITDDDYLAIPLNKNSIIPEFYTNIKVNQYSEKQVKTILDDKDYWYLMGYYLGDGWLIESKKEIYFSINEKQKDEILKRLKNILGLSRLENTGENVKKYVGKKQQVYEILSHFGKYAHSKKIPNFVYDAPKYLLEEFINGYFDADGGKTPDGISYTTVSENIAYGIQLIYAKLGIKASVIKQNRPEETYIQGRLVNQRPTYNINIYKGKNKSNNFLFSDDYLWLKIRKIEKYNFDGYVYNISVDKNHTYNVWNIINHNCHFGFQCYTSKLSLEQRQKWYAEKLGKSEHYVNELGHEFLTEMGVPERKLDLKWFQRSCDFPLGIPMNIASYAILLHLLAKEANMVPNRLIFNGGDCHIYKNQIDGVKEQLKQETYKLPKLVLKNDSIFDLKFEDIEIVDYESAPTIKFPLSN